MNKKKLLSPKKTKKSEIIFDMKPFIYECTYDTQNTCINLIVDASSAGNIKPTLVLKALYALHQQTLDEFGVLITREETYANVGTEVQFY